MARFRVHGGAKRRSVPDLCLAQEKLLRPFLGTYADDEAVLNESTDWCDTQSGWIEQAAFDSAWRLIVEQVCHHSPGQDAHVRGCLCVC